IIYAAKYEATHTPTSQARSLVDVVFDTERIFRNQEKTNQAPIDFVELIPSETVGWLGSFMVSPPKKKERIAKTNQNSGSHADNSGESNTEPEVKKEPLIQVSEDENVQYLIGLVTEIRSKVKYLKQGLTETEPVSQTSNSKLSERDSHQHFEIKKEKSQRVATSRKWFSTVFVDSAIKQSSLEPPENTKPLKDSSESRVDKSDGGEWYNSAFSGKQKNANPWRKLVSQIFV
ncbi:hypothetical protein HDU99_006858, partial [Rhizoclosmatium hyalinum]